MTAYLARKLVAATALLLGLSLVLFLIFLPLSARATDMYRSPCFARVSSCFTLIEGGLDRWKERHGLSGPLYERYADWLWSALRGDLGESMVPPTDSVASSIAGALPATLAILLLAAVIAALLGVGVGALSAVRRNEREGAVFRGLTSAGGSIPVFWLALLLIHLPLWWWGWTPHARDWVSLTDDPLRHLVIVVWPALALALALAALTARSVRASMRDALDSGYARTAHAKGLPGRRVIRGHAFRNALIPVIALGGPWTGALLGGVVLVEPVFGIPGLGSLAFEAALSQDYPLVLGTVMVFAVLLVLAGLVGDVVRARADPRLRTPVWPGSGPSRPASLPRMLRAAPTTRPQA